jgi:hypothetical protein
LQRKASLERPRAAPPAAPRAAVPEARARCSQIRSRRATHAPIVADAVDRADGERARGTLRARARRPATRGSASAPARRQRPATAATAAPGARCPGFGPGARPATPRSDAGGGLRAAALRYRWPHAR